MDENENKRHFKRLEQYLKVRFYFGDNTQPVQVYTKDISLGGIHIHSPLSIDQRYQFPMLVYISDEPVRVIARVAWQRQQENSTDWEMGLEFVQIKDSDRERIAQFLKKAE